VRSKFEYTWLSAEAEVRHFERANEGRGGTEGEEEEEEEVPRTAREMVKKRSAGGKLKKEQGEAVGLVELLDNFNRRTENEGVRDLSWGLFGGSVRIDHPVKWNFFDPTFSARYFSLRIDLGTSWLLPTIHPSILPS
jgi:hypothetical protein